MLLLLSPAKTLDYETPVPDDIRALATTPRHVDEARQLIATLRTRTPAEIASLMDLSESLAQLNVGRYAAWSPRFTAHNSKPAALAFDGDVYDGLQARQMSADDLAWAQRHVVILSGLYGLLRPLDKLQPYRLEMGTRLATERGSDLYDWWGDRLARELSRLSAADARETGGERVVVNLASQEYFRAADRPALKARVIECVFEDWKGGGYKIISFFAKRARGAMARHAVLRRLTDPQGLKDFDADGYAYAAEASSTDRWVFRRRTEG